MWRRDLCGAHLRQQPPSQGTGFSTPHKYPLGSGWLGGVSLDAANIYAEIDLEVKANSLAKSALVPEKQIWEAMARLARLDGLLAQVTVD